MTRVLILPGWQNSLAGHWQTLWQQRYGYQRVEQANWQQPQRQDWVANLEQAVAQEAQPCVLVAHSLGCLLTAHWAQQSTATGKIKGALLVAPPDVDAIAELRNFTPFPRHALPFPGIVVASSNDNFSHIDWSRRLASDWGSEFIDIGACGHINGESGLGDWTQGHRLIAGWMDQP